MTMKRAAALGLLLMGCGSAADETGDEVRIGLLLPYTGKDSWLGANYERSVLMAAEQVEARGGLGKRPLRLIYADTHSDVQGGMASARSLVDQGVVAIIGPGDDELARQLSAALAAKDVALLTPSSSSVTSSDDPLWFRLAPAARDLGNALARRIKSDNAQRVAVVSTTALYEQRFATAAHERLASDGVAPLISRVISARDSELSETIDAISATKPDAIVLAADAGIGSRFVNEYASAAGAAGIKWYLSPSLEHQDFVLSLPSDVVETMVGVAVGVGPGTGPDEFQRAFVERWDGESPTIGASFYYDALALYAIAYEGAARRTRRPEPSNGEVRGTLLRAGPTMFVKWNELSEGLDRARDGDVDGYHGVTGWMKFNATGSRVIIYTRLWTIRDGQIAPVQDDNSVRDQ